MGFGASLFLLAVFTSALHAQQTQRYPGSNPNPSYPGVKRVRCESQNNRRSYCGADTRGGVSVARQLSQVQCIQGRNRGFDARGIWVDQGCRAEFLIGAYTPPPNWGHLGPGRPPGPSGGTGACFYNDINFGGDFFCLRRGQGYRNLPPGYNDRISSIRIFGGSQVIVYNDINFGGRRGATNRDIPNMKNWRTADDPSRTWNDRISSIQVR